MKLAEIRRAFLDYFKEHGHTEVPSSSLIPAEDPSLLFTNAGMVQFKDMFLLPQAREYKTATSCQRVVRAGGKHNDLENVGFTARHLTFFEMLGNFSFGDYFKLEAIKFSWELVTKIFKIPKDKLWITVHKDDSEAEKIWLKEIGIAKERVIKCDEDNFWAMGDTGPCGPCTEIFYDMGKDVPGGLPGSEDEGDRYVEFWNMVFMQYNRDATGKMTPLPDPCVDTGLGLERTASILQGVQNVYDIDLFQNIIKGIKKILKPEDPNQQSLQVVADHLRSSAFLIVDGIVPSNEGRGYVLRRIMRRAIRHGHKMQVKQPFFHKVVPVLIKEMAEAYPELATKEKQIANSFKQEEEQFAVTLEQGVKLFNSFVKEHKSKTIPGKFVFQLYDTYGFPLDLTQTMAAERGLEVDLVGFEASMQQQRDRARKESKFKVNLDIDPKLQTKFTGYDTLTDTANISAIYKDNQKIDKLEAGETAAIVLEQSPFYAESGGQVGDQGYIKCGNNIYRVEDTQKQGKAYLHLGTQEQGNMHVGDKVVAEVDEIEREAIKLNHSATHLLHAALRRILGEHVQQKGSVVDKDRLRFDFSHNQPVTQEELHAIESLINEKIRENTQSVVKVMPLEEAKKTGAIALFGEKYDSDVRVLAMAGDFSVELCGGTHVDAAGDVGFFKITAETGIASGVRRIEAVTGSVAIQWVQDQEATLKNLGNTLKADAHNIDKKIEQLLARNKQLEKDLKKSQQNVFKTEKDDLMSEVKKISDINVLATIIPTGDKKTLRLMLDDLKNKLKPAVIILALKSGSNADLIVGVTKDISNKIAASEIIKHLCKELDGKGGGRSDMAQAGISQVDKLPAALVDIHVWIKNKLP